MEHLIKCGDALIDTREITAVAYNSNAAVITFRNGDTIQLAWRDPKEEASIRGQLSTIAPSTSPVASAQS